MPSRTDQAVVLARYPYRERDLIVALLTRMSGQVRVLARTARGQRSIFAGALEPLALATVTYFERPRSELAKLDAATLVRSSFPLAREPLAWAAGQVVAELSLLYCPPGQRVEPLFRLVDRCLENLLAGHRPAAVVDYASYWFLRLAGVLPELDRCAVCGADLPPGGRAFDAKEGGYVCAEHRAGRSLIRIAEASAAWMRDAARLPVEQVPHAAPADAAELLTSLQRQFTDKELSSTRYFALLLGQDAEHG